MSPDQPFSKEIWFDPNPILLVIHWQITRNFVEELWTEESGQTHWKLEKRVFLMTAGPCSLLASLNYQLVMGKQPSLQPHYIFWEEIRKVALTLWLRLALYRSVGRSVCCKQRKIIICVTSWKSFYFLYIESSEDPRQRWLSSLFT